MCDKINEYFDPLFSKLRCVFRKGFNLQHYFLVLAEVLDKWGNAGILLTDLFKAFDCINHELLLAKLHTYSFSLESLKVIQSYLSDQIQRVKITSSLNGYCNVESGVPQGSISDLLCILIFSFVICSLMMPI